MCMYVHVDEYVHVRLHVYSYLRVLVYVRVHACIKDCVYLQIGKVMCMCARVFVCVRARVGDCVHVRVYMNTRACASRVCKSITARLGGRRDR